MFPNTFKFAFQEVGMKFHISESEKWGEVKNEPVGVRNAGKTL